MLNFPKKIFWIDLKEKTNEHTHNETGLNWKALPHKLLVSRQEKWASGFKISNESLTIMTYANAKGSHALKITEENTKTSF